jgi:hypothetical protein
MNKISPRRRSESIRKGAKWNLTFFLSLSPPSIFFIIIRAHGDIPNKHSAHSDTHTNASMCHLQFFCLLSMSELRKLDFIGITAKLALKIVYFPFQKKNPRHNSVWLAQIYTAKSEKQNRCWQSQSENDKSKLACCVYVRYTEPSHPFFAFRQPYFAFRFLSIPHKKAYERSSSRKEIFLHALTMGP